MILNFIIQYADKGIEGGSPKQRLGVSYGGVFVYGCVGQKDQVASREWSYVSPRRYDVESGWKRLWFLYLSAQGNGAKVPTKKWRSHKWQRRSRY